EKNPRWHTDSGEQSPLEGALDGILVRGPSASRRIAGQRFREREALLREPAAGGPPVPGGAIDRRVEPQERIERDDRPVGTEGKPAASTPDRVPWPAAGGTR